MDRDPVKGCGIPNGLDATPSLNVSSHTCLRGLMQCVPCGGFLGPIDCIASLSPPEIDRHSDDHVALDLLKKT